jgi:hypothetical protein
MHISKKPCFRSLPEIMHKRLLYTSRNKTNLEAGPSIKTGRQVKILCVFTRLNKEDLAVYLLFYHRKNMLRR